MNPEKQRIAIAKACGWRVESTLADGVWKLYCGDVATSFWWNRDKIPTIHDVAHMLPSYLDDLNAIHEAEKQVIIPRVLGQEYAEAISDVNCINEEYGDYHATAAQRAEAFLRVLDLWEENQ